MKPKRKTALKLTLLLLIFLAPFIGAIFVYQARDGIHFMTKNAGQLIRPSVDFETLGFTMPTEQRWWMVYYAPEVCDSNCEKAIAHFETIRQSLIKDSGRLGILILTREENNPPVLSMPSDHLYLLKQALPENLPVIDQQGVWLMDPLGNIILNYDPVTLDNRMLLDLRHLLKVSRIG